MADEQTKETTGVPKTFLQKLGTMGYPAADAAAKVEIIEHPDKEYRCYGFRDANGRALVAITLPVSKADLFEKAVKA